MQPRDRVSEADARQRLQAFDAALLMWELPPQEPTPPPITTVVPSDAVLAGTPSVLLAGEEWLPEDFYVFDASQTWAACFTHEWIDGFGRYCLWSVDHDAAT